LKFGVFNSLRRRYAVVAGAVTVVVLASAYLGHVQLWQARTETTDNVTVRNHLLEHSRVVRNAVWMTRESLATFLLDPDNEQQRAQIHLHIVDAQNETQQLLIQPWIIHHQYQSNIQLLADTLAELDQASATLIKTRLDIRRQYPALALARADMLPDHSVFYTAAALAIGEILEQDIAQRNQDAYQSFIQVRHLWTQMISNFRMYLANKLGSFAIAALPVQEQDVLTQFQAIKQLIVHLQQLDRQGQLEFQGGVSLQGLEQAADHWHRTFEEIVRIHNTDDWRADSKLIRTSIKPRMEVIWSLLINLDKSIESSANDDVSVLTRVAESQTQTLWLFTALCVALIVFGFFGLERMVIRPVASIAAALKTESEDLDGSALPAGATRETRDLIDAFLTMRKQVQARQTALEYHALHDSLTNLGNRNRLIDHLNLAIKQAEREHADGSGGALALLMLDLNHFKEVNDTLGHPAGDQLLIEVGLRLSGLLRDSDTIARLGGDEFAILLPTANETNAIKIADKIATALSHPFCLDDRQLYANASVGISLYPQHGMTARTLLQRADIAMYQAKHSKMQQAVYNSDEDQHSIERLGLMADLRQALRHNTLEIHYQPQLSLSHGTVTGMEALLRWQHPEHGYIAPEEIITLAEQTGLIHEIAYWVLGHAVTQSKNWLDAGIPLTIAVNLSAQNLQDDRVVDQVRSLLAKTQFPAQNLTLEITENAMMADPDRAVQVLTHLDAMGVRIAVDDFGTGFSSLGYLKRLPVHELKIDKSFVTDMASDDNDAVIVRSTIDLAHNLGLTVVAEGVEDQEIWDILQILRCDTAQGYFMSRPLPATEFIDWLQNHSAEKKPGRSGSGRAAG
jgi:diguanylate cyclase (GGDEF)-like protein